VVREADKHVIATFVGVYELLYLKSVFTGLTSGGFVILAAVQFQGKTSEISYS